MHETSAEDYPFFKKETDFTFLMRSLRTKLGGHTSKNQKYSNTSFDLTQCCCCCSHFYGLSFDDVVYFDEVWT